MAEKELEHCGHECKGDVCHEYRKHLSISYEPCPVTCSHDTRTKQPTGEPMYLISESELDQIKNDCLYPERPDCNGCECAEGVDDTRASGLGCTFKGANILMDEVIARGTAPDCSGCSYKRGLSFSLPKDTTTIENIVEGLNALSDYFNAALNGDENKTALYRMWNMQIGILHSLLKHLNCDKCHYKQFAANIANAEAREKAVRDGVLDALKEIVHKKFDSAYRNTCRYDREALGDKADEPNNKFYFTTYCGYATAFGMIENDIESLHNPAAWEWDKGKYVYKGAGP